MNHLKEWETSNWLWQIVHYIIIGIDNDIGKNFDICIHLNSLPRMLILYLVRVCTPRIHTPGGVAAALQLTSGHLTLNQHHRSISHLVTHHTSTHLYFLHKWTHHCLYYLFMLAQCTCTHPNVQFFTTYIDLCKSFIIIFSCRISIFNLNPWSILTHMKLMLWSHLNTYLWCCLLCLCGLDVTPSHSPTTC